jgi:hypothetical protein
MKQAVPETVHQIDEFGYLVRLPDETDADYATRTATVLHQSGASPNTPADVEAQYDAEEPPPLVREADEDPAAFAERERAQHDEWAQENQRLREEALATARSEEEERRSHLAGPQPHDEEEEVDETTGHKVRKRRR